MYVRLYTTGALNCGVRNFTTDGQEDPNTGPYPLDPDADPQVNTVFKTISLSIRNGGDPVELRLKQSCKLSRNYAMLHGDEGGSRVVTFFM